MSEPNYPIFLFDGFDLSVATSLEDLRADLEPVDAQSGIFDTYDAEGRKVRLGTTKGRVDAQIDLMQPAAVESFEHRLRTFLRAKGDSAGDDPTCNLSLLIHRSRELA